MSNQEESKLVELNVGGIEYITTEKTLKNEPNSLFIQILESDNSLKIRDKIFIDRDGQLFRYVLDYLRNKTLVLPESFNEKRRLKCEAEYFKLKNMVNFIDELDLPNGLSSASLSSLNNKISSKKAAGCIIVGYRGTFANSRDGMNDVILYIIIFFFFKFL